MFEPNQYMQQYRAEHPEYVERHKATQKKRSEANQVWINEYLKSHPCVDCGEIDPVVLEFDHTGEHGKRRHVTGLTSNSIPKILEEIKKCDVVCANCHRKRTAMRANTIRWKLNNSEGDSWQTR